MEANHEQYQHLTLEERVLIKTKLEADCSFRKIAKDLGKSPYQLPGPTLVRQTLLQEEDLCLLQGGLFPPLPSL